MWANRADFTSEDHEKFPSTDLEADQNLKMRTRKNSFERTTQNSPNSTFSSDIEYIPAKDE